VIAEQMPHLAPHERRCIGGEARPAIRLEPVDGRDEADDARLAQILLGEPRGAVVADDRAHEPLVAQNQRLAGLSVPGLRCCDEPLVRRRGQQAARKPRRRSSDPGITAPDQRTSPPKRRLGPGFDRSENRTTERGAGLIAGRAARLS
jgi:hypothetical protein